MNLGWFNTPNSNSMEPNLAGSIAQLVLLGVSSPIQRGAHDTGRICARRSIQMVDDRWLSVDEIAQYLQVKRDTVYKGINRKQKPAHKVGRL